jgi:hypothetical protein
MVTSPASVASTAQAFPSGPESVIYVLLTVPEIVAVHADVSKAIVSSSNMHFLISLLLDIQLLN